MTIKAIVRKESYPILNKLFSLFLEICDLFTSFITLKSISNRFSPGSSKASADTTQSELTLKKDPDAEFGRL